MKIVLNLTEITRSCSHTLAMSFQICLDCLLFLLLHVFFVVLFLKAYDMNKIFISAIFVDIQKALSGLRRFFGS